jgi:hypothetical protein
MRSEGRSPAGAACWATVRGALPALLPGRGTCTGRGGVEFRPRVRGLECAAERSWSEKAPWTPTVSIIVVISSSWRAMLLRMTSTGDRPGTVFVTVFMGWNVGVTHQGARLAKREQLTFYSVQTAMKASVGEAGMAVDDEVLLTRARAAEHVLLAIAEAREDLLTRGLLACSGFYTALRESANAPASWDYGGYAFVQSGAVAVLGAAATITAPMEAPTLLLGGAAYIATNGLSFLSDAEEAKRRSSKEQNFVQAYGIRSDELLWSMAPTGVRFWYLADGDTVLELILKAKRGPLGLGDNVTKCQRILCRVLSLMPGSAVERSERLEAATVKAERDLSLPAGALNQHVQTARSMLAREWVAAAASPQAGTAGSSAGSAALDAAPDLGMSSNEWEVVAGGAGARPSSPPPSVAGDSSCIVCLSMHRTHAVIPCGHRCLCTGCADLVAIERACPICRSHADGLLRVYDP